VAGHGGAGQGSAWRGVARLGKARGGPVTGNLNQNEELALRIDEMVKEVRPDSWRGVEPKERVIKQALFGILRDEHEVERIFLIIKAQSGY
jgi:hypothetical protein